MNNKIIGIVLIIAGIGLALWGYNLYDSVGSQFSRAFKGDAPLESWAAMAGGVICLIIGILKIK